VSETTAISKLKTARPVPGIAPTVTCAYPFTSKRLTVLHIVEVPEVHIVVEQLATFPAPPISSPAVAVCSPIPKFNPETVTGAKPDKGMFMKMPDTTAVSKLKTGRLVLATVATVTVMLPKISARGFERHASVVADVHEDVRHEPRSPPPPRSSPAVAV
jgi:hypothetical protein